MMKKSGSDSDDDMNRSRRQPTHYTAFMSEELLRLKALHPDLGHKDRFRLAANKWTTEERHKYPVSDRPKTTPRKRVKSLGKKKGKSAEKKKKKRQPREKTAHIAFMSEQLLRLKEDNPNMAHKERFRIAASRWTELKQLKQG